MKQKMSINKFVLSKEGVKREQRGSKKGVKRGWGWSMLASGGGKGGAYAALDPCLRRILT